MGCKMLGIVNPISKSPGLIVGGMERKEKSPTVVINPHGVKPFNKNIFKHSSPNLAFSNMSYSITATEDS